MGMRDCGLLSSLIKAMDSERVVNELRIEFLVFFRYHDILIKVPHKTASTYLESGSPTHDRSPLGMVASDVSSAWSWHQEFRGTSASHPLPLSIDVLWSALNSHLLLTSTHWRFLGYLSFAPTPSWYFQ